MPTDTPSRSFSESCPTPRELRCFIIMPFSSAEFIDPSGNRVVLDEKKLTHIYRELFKKAIESYDKNGIHITSNRYSSNRGNFIKGIVSDLDTADIVVADLTSLNNNVFYELGIRHTLRTGALLLTQNKKEIASDLSNYIALEYKYPQNSVDFDDYYPEFEKTLHNALDEFLANPSKADNPVRDFIGNRIIFQNERRIAEVKGNIELMRIVADEYVDTVRILGKALESWSRGEVKGTYKLYNTAEQFLTRLFLLNEKESVISFVKKIVQSIEVIQINMRMVIDKVKGSKNPAKLQEVPFGYRDAEGNSYSIWELYVHYGQFKEDVSKIAPCPIKASFQKFIKEWEDELDNLTK
jgi:hypothetical protein